MLGQAHRFHGYNALRAVYKHGRTVRGELLSLRFTHRDARRSYRVAVVVSRKVHKSAVTRNRIRRRVYATVRQAESAIAPGTDLVFTVFGDRLAELPPAELRHIVTNLLKKAAAPPPNQH